MSADLFAAFEDPPGQRPNQAPPKPSPQIANFPSGLASFQSSAANNTSIQETQPWPSLESTHNDPWGDFNTGLPGGGGDAAKDTFGDDDDDDGWGDFETAEPSQKPTPIPQLAQATLPGPSFTKPAPQKPAMQRTRIIRAPTIELMTGSLIDLPGVNNLPEEVRSPPWVRHSFEQKEKSIAKSTQQPPKTTAKAAKSDPNVLFDADDFDGKIIEEEDDDFGDFETTTSPVQTASQDLISADLFTPPPTARPPTTAKRMNTADMFSALTLNGPKSPYPQAPKSPAFHDRNPFPGLALHTPTEPRPSQHDDDPKTSPVTAWPGIDQESAKRNSMDGGWGAFDDLPEEPTPSKQNETTNDDWGDWDSFETKPHDSNKTQTNKQMVKDDTSNWAWDALDSPKEDSLQANEDKAPPINVPPPSILLSIFPELLEQANDSLYKPVSGQAFSVKNRILSDPKTIDFLRGYLLLATVAARVIAGRKQRWHRDKFLSQSMSISAAGSKGMKLAGVDKTQSARDDREAADILDLWKEHVGRLRSSVATANSSLKDASKHLKIPELRENIQIQTAKGVLTAPKACIICGLKRDERLARVDFEVEDSFGEWWTDHWGHTACKRFWLKHESALRQR